MFSQATITEGPVCEPDGAATLVWWSSSSPDDGSMLFQVYANRAPIWHGSQRHVTLPTAPGTVLYQVGTVGPDEGNVDFSASLPLLMGTGNRASIDWLGGKWEGADTLGFHVYGSPAPGGAVNYAAALATIPLYAPGIPTDGYGMGGYGGGGYGSAGGHYWWTSDPLANGVWTFAVLAYDAAGNPSTVKTVAVAISGPPGAPARNAAGSRLTYTCNATTHVATLNWLASPG